MSRLKNIFALTHLRHFPMICEQLTFMPPMNRPGIAPIFTQASPDTEPSPPLECRTARAQVGRQCQLSAALSGTRTLATRLQEWNQRSRSRISGRCTERDCLSSASPSFMLHELQSPVSTSPTNTTSRFYGRRDLSLSRAGWPRPREQVITTTRRALRRPRSCPGSGLML